MNQIKRIACAALFLIICGDYLAAQSSGNPRSGVAIDTSQVRPPVFPSPDEVAEIKNVRVVRKFPEVGFQFSGSFGLLDLSKLNASYQRAEQGYGVELPSNFGGGQFAPDFGVRISFSRKIISVFQWLPGGKPSDGGFRYSLVSSSLLFSPVSSEEFFIFFGAGVGHYQLRATRTYNHDFGNAILKEMTLDDCSLTVTPIITMLEFRPRLAPQYSLFMMVRWIPNKTRSFVNPLWGTSDSSIEFDADMGGTWLTLGFSYGI